MGLALPALRFLANEHRRNPIKGPVLTLGRQYVFGTYDQVRSILKSEGIEPRPLDPDLSLQTNIPKWRGKLSKKFGMYTSDEVFFRLLGTEMLALDVSDYQSADIVHDLNHPIPTELENRFDLIIDAGTIEHVFDVKQVLISITRMLRPGGRIIHMSPSSGYSGHGFYQFSPGLFFDYYGANKFSNLQCTFVEAPLKSVLSKTHQPPATNSWDTFECRSGYYERLFITDKMLSVYFRAEKTDMSTGDVIPQQGQYQAADKIDGDRKITSYRSSSDQTGQKMAQIVRRTKALIPGWMRHRLRTVIGLTRAFRLRRHEVARHRKPWGLRYTGKL